MYIIYKRFARRYFRVYCTYSAYNIDVSFFFMQFSFLIR